MQGIPKRRKEVNWMEAEDSTAKFLIWVLWRIALTSTWSRNSTSRPEQRTTESQHPHQSGWELQGFCTTVLCNNQKACEIKSSEVDDLNAHVAALTSQYEQLDGCISSADNEVSDITNALAEATNNRDRRFRFSCS